MEHYQTTISTGEGTGMTVCPRWPRLGFGWLVVVPTDVVYEWLQERQGQPHAGQR